jgi:hypothetical protein
LQSGLYNNYRHLRFKWLNNPQKIERRKAATTNRQEQQQQQPEATTIAEQLKDKASLDKKTKLLGDLSNIKAQDR